MCEVVTYIYVCLFDASSVVQDLEYAPLLSLFSFMLKISPVLHVLEIEFLLSLVLNKVTSYHVPSLTRVEVLFSQLFQCTWPSVLVIVLTPTYHRHQYLGRLSDRNHLTQRLVHSFLQT